MRHCCDTDSAGYRNRLIVCVRIPIAFVQSIIAAIAILGDFVEILMLTFSQKASVKYRAVYVRNVARFHQELPHEAV